MKTGWFLSRSELSSCTVWRIVPLSYFRRMRRWRTFADVRLLINPTCAPPTCYVAAKTVSAHVVIFLYSFTYFFQLSCSYKHQKRNYCNINSPAWCRSEIICTCLLFLLFLSFIDLLIYSAGCYPAALKIKRNAPIRSAERLVFVYRNHPDSSLLRVLLIWGGFCVTFIKFLHETTAMREFYLFFLHKKP